MSNVARRRKQGGGGEGGGRPLDSWFSCELGRSKGQTTCNRMGYYCRSPNPNHLPTPV